MTYVFLVSNPFDRSSYVMHQAPSGGTVRDWLRRHFGSSFEEFSLPTICIHNGTPLMRKDWDTLVLADDDHVEFVAIPGWGGVVIAIVVAIVVAVAVVLLMPTPAAPGEMKEADSAYTLSGQRNKIRLMDPIEVPYGKCRLFPSYATRPYNVYRSNQQHQFNLFCLGHGYYDIHSIQVEDTAIENLDDVAIEIVQPGELVTLFPNNVVTVAEVSSIELFGANETAWSGAAGPFTANPSGTVTDKLEFDIVFAQGLYMSYEGGVYNFSVGLLFEARLIDDAGDPLGAWFSVVTQTITRRTNNPQRITFEASVPSGRYEVRGSRTTDKNRSIQVANTMVWESCRAFLPSTKRFEGVTIIAIRAKASNQLNDNTRARFNVYATRKLPTYDPALNDGAGGWTEPVATRSLVWAFCDAFMNTAYGAKVDGSALDLDTLVALDALYTEREEFFDWVFDQRITVWEAAKAIARVGRAIPMPSGSKITMVRDGPKAIATAMFTPENIVQDSLRREIRFHTPDELTAYEVEYTDPETWLAETVICSLPGVSAENVEPIKLSGCTDRAHAFREGMKTLATNLYTRENCIFRTGMEGHIPSFGDLIFLSHDVLRKHERGQSGFLIGIEDPVEGMEIAGDPAHANNGPIPASFCPYFYTTPTGMAYRDRAEGYPYTEIGFNTFQQRWFIYYYRAEAEYVSWRSAICFWPSVTKPSAATDWEFYDVVGEWTDLDFFPVVTAKTPGHTLELSTSVAFGPPWVTHGIALRRSDGSPAGPYLCDQGQTSNKVILRNDLPNAGSYPIDDFNREPVHYMFGLTERVGRKMQISNIQPGQDEDVELTCFPYKDIVHSFDGLEVPSLEEPDLPPSIPDLPVVTSLTATESVSEPGYALVSWNPATGASSYRLEMSWDNVNWDLVADQTATSILVPVQAGTLYLRVAGFNVGFGPWATWSGPVGFPSSLPPTPTMDAGTFTGLEAMISWQAIPGVSQFRVYVMDETETTTIAEVDVFAATSYEYTHDQAVADGFVARTYAFRVASVNALGESDPLATQELTNPATTAASGLTAGAPTGSSYPVSWSFTVPADFLQFKVYSSTTSPVAISPGNLRYTGTAPNTTLTGVTVTTYWVVTTMDVWGNEETASAEATITI